MALFWQLLVKKNAKYSCFFEQKIFFLRYNSLTKNIETFNEWVQNFWNQNLQELSKHLKQDGWPVPVAL